MMHMQTCVTGCSLLDILLKLFFSHTELLFAYWKMLVSGYTFAVQVPDSDDKDVNVLHNCKIT